MVNLNINGFNSDPRAQGQLDQTMAAANGNKTSRGQNNPKDNSKEQLLAQLFGGQQNPNGANGQKQLEQGAFGDAVPEGMQVTGNGFGQGAQSPQGAQGAQTPDAKGAQASGGAGGGPAIAGKNKDIPEENPADQLRKEFEQARDGATEISTSGGAKGDKSVQLAAGNVAQQIGGQMGQVNQVGKQAQNAKKIGGKAEKILKKAENILGKANGLQSKGTKLQEAGQGMVQAGTQMIATGIAMQANPFTAAAGKALEAAGQALVQAGEGLDKSGKALEKAGKNMEKLGKLQEKTGKKHSKLAEKIGKQADKALNQMRDSARSAQETVDRLKQGDKTGDYDATRPDLQNRTRKMKDKNKAFSKDQAQGQKEIDQMFREAEEGGKSGNEQPGRGQAAAAGNETGAGDSGNQFGGANPFGGAAVADAGPGLNLGGIGGGAGVAVSAIPMPQAGAVA